MNKNRNHLTKNVVYINIFQYIIKAKNNILDKNGMENMSNMSIIFNLFYFILYKAYSNLKGVANCRKNKGVYATSINVVYIKK